MPMMITEMYARQLRPLRPSRFRRVNRRESVEVLMELIGDLTAERQHLRETGATAGKLERNRVKLARTQWELSHALIARYLPPQRSEAA
jgi:nitrogen regulatory protein PII-like uncharacterized protein